MKESNMVKALSNLAFILFILFAYQNCSNDSAFSKKQPGGKTGSESSLNSTGEPYEGKPNFFVSYDLDASCSFQVGLLPCYTLKHHYVALNNHNSTENQLVGGTSSSLIQNQHFLVCFPHGLHFNNFWNSHDLKH